MYKFPVSRTAQAVCILACLLFLNAGPMLGQIPPLKAGPLSVPPGEGTCSVEKSCAELAPAMMRSALGISPLEENLRYLTDSIGGRITGSPEADRAVGWAVEALRYAGVDEVHTEKFAIPAGWSEGRTRAEVLTAGQLPVHLVSVAWAPPTPDGGITADVVDVGSGDDPGYLKAGARANGAIVLVHSRELATWDDINQEQRTIPGIVGRAVRAGAAAIFWTSTRPNLLLYRQTASPGGQPEPLPEAVLAREDAERIARFIASGQQVRVHLEMPNHVTTQIESENVAAEIRGREAG